MCSINTCWQECQFSKEIAGSKLNPYTAIFAPLALSSQITNEVYPLELQEKKKIKWLILVEQQ